MRMPRPRPAVRSARPLPHSAASGLLGRPLRALRGYGAVTMVATAVTVFLLALAAVELAPPDTGVAAWWPAAGVSVLAVAWAPRDRRLAVVATIAVASGLANVVAGRSPAVAVGFGLSNAAEAFVVAWWLLRDSARPSLASLEDVTRLVVATLLGGLVMGLGAGTTVALAGGDFVVTARTVMASHGAAILVVTPFGMRVPSGRAPGRIVEGVVQTLALVLSTVAVFAPQQTLPLTFLPMPFLVWGALRLGTRTVAAQLLLVSVVVTVMSRFDTGPFASESGVGPTLAVSLVQAYLVVSALVALSLAVSVGQRRAVLQRVVASERLYRSGFSEALLGMLLLRRCEPDHPDHVDGPERGHRARPGAGAPEAPDATEHAGGGLDVVELNAVAGRILGASEEELVGRSWTARLETGDRAMLAEAVASMADGELPGWHGELALAGADGLRWVEVALSPLPAEAGDGMFVGQMVDVSSRRAAEERLTAQALQDGLTGLANRTLLRDRISLALRTLPAGRSVAVLFCDLDDFKHVNDSTGHTSGDGVLVEVAHRMRTLLRPDDVAARLGGDEFVVLRPHVQGEAEAEELAGAVLGVLGEPVVVAGRPVSVGASIGIALGSAEASPDDLLRDADAAMYAAKAEGKRRAVVYSDEHRARALRSVRIATELRGAAERGELDVHLQPVVDLTDGRLLAAEALIRWQHPERGLLVPAEWLDVAEESGLMPEIGAWVLERSCELAAAWPVEGPDAPTVHVNVSARQLDRPGFVDLVRAALERTGLAADRLVLEFTETQLDEVSESLLADLMSLRAVGVRLAADDYGTGYSPLTRIMDLPISMIKIDRRFVAGMLDDVRSRAIVMTLVRLSQSLGLELVAEGVETREQAAELRRLGCRAGQGYLWSRPVPAEDFERRFVEEPARR